MLQKVNRCNTFGAPSHPHIDKSLKTSRWLVCPLIIKIGVSNRQVRILVPKKMDDEVIRKFVISKIPCIRKHQSRFIDQEVEEEK